MLAAVDAHVGRRLFAGCVKGLLRGKCVLLATNALEVLEACDQVVVMTRGEVQAVGPFERVCEGSGVLADLVAAREAVRKGDGGEEGDKHNECDENDTHDTFDTLEHSNQRHDGHDAPHADKEINDVSKTTQQHTEMKPPIPTTHLDDLSTQQTNTVLSDPNSTDGTPNPNSSNTVSSDPNPATSPDAITPSVISNSASSSHPAASTVAIAPSAGDLTEKERRVEGTVSRSVYMLYLTAVGGMCVVMGLLSLYLFTEVLRVGTNYWVTLWSNDAAHRPARFYIAGYAALAALSVVLLGVRTLSLYLAGIRASRSLHDQLLCGLFFSPMSFFDRTPLGRITNRVSKDMYAIDKTLPATFGSLLTSLFSVAATLCVLVAALPWFLAILPIIAVYYLYEQRFYVRSSREMKRLESLSRSPIYAHFGETLDGTAVIRAFRSEDRFIGKSGKLLDGNQKAYFLQSAANCWLGLRLEFAGTTLVGAAAALAVAGKQAGNPGFTAGAALALAYALDVTQSLNWVVRQVAELQTQVVAVERVEEYANLPREGGNSSRQAPQGWPERGEVEFQNVVMRYRPDLEPVLRQLSLHLRPAEKVGIVGRTGAGKSSLMLALMRIVEIDGGKITIDGIDVQTLSLQVLRAAIAIIPQEPRLFAGTIRSNLDPFREYSDEAIWSALERASMKMVIVESPAGLETMVEEHGNNFSVGQRQLLCIARALLRKSRVILMDEATASIDLETDLQIQKTIRTQFADCTVITVAHRIHTIIDSDRVVVMDMGEVKEFDTPDALLKNPQSLFSQLVEKSKQIDSVVCWINEWCYV